MTPTPDEARAGVSAWAKIGAVLIAAVACLTYAAYTSCSTGCSALPPQSPATARAEARAADLAAADAVAIGYKTCSLAVAALDGAPKEDLRAKCHAALDPAAAGVELGAQAVDAWDDTAAASYACAMQDVLGGLTKLEVLMSPEPPVLVDALVLLRAQAPTCTRPPPLDATAPPANVQMPPLGDFDVPTVDAGGAS